MPLFSNPNRLWLMLGGAHVALLGAMLLMSSGDNTDFTDPAIFPVELIIASFSVLGVVFHERMTKTIERIPTPVRVLWTTVVVTCIIFATYPVRILDVIFAILLGSTAALFVYPASVPISLPRVHWLWLVLPVLFVLMLRIYTLAVLPRPHSVDEAWSLGIALNYLVHGQRGDLLMNIESQENDPVDQAEPLFPLFAALTAGWMAVIGVGVWEARLLHLLLTLLVIAFTARTAYHWYGKQTAWFTAAILFSSSVLLGTANTRPDIGLCLAVSASLWLYNEAKVQQRNFFYLLAGLAVGLGVFAHFNAIFLGITLTLALFLPRYVVRWRQERRWLPERAMLLYILGGFIAAFIAAVVIVLPDPQAFWAITSVRSSVSGEDPQFWFAFTNGLFNIYRHSGIEFVLVLVALVVAGLRRRDNDWTLLLFFVLGHFSVGLISASPQYVRPLVPCYAMLIATMFSLPLRVKTGSGWQARRVAFFAFTSGILLLMTMRDAVLYVAAGAPMRPQPPPAVEWLIENVSVDQVVVGPNHYFLWMPQYHHYHSTYLPYFYRRELRLTEVSDYELWDAVNPDVIIYDAGEHEVMLPDSLFASDYLATRGYTVVWELNNAQSVVRIYRRSAALFDGDD